MLILFSTGFAYAKKQENHFFLINGLEVHLIKNNNPIVTQLITYNVGSMEENSSNSGIAHYLEHVMFLGTYRYSKSNFSNMMKQASAQYNAFTSYDITGYYITAPNTYIEELIAIESDRMRGLIFNQKAIENEKQVVKEEKNMLQNSSYNNFFEVLRQSQYPISNYGKNIIGYDSSFFKISSKDLKDFYQKWYHPQNARLFIIGSIDIRQVTRLVKKHYGKIKPCRDCDFKRPNYLEDPYQANLFVEYKDRAIDKDLLVLSYMAPSVGSVEVGGRNKVYALYMLARLLSSNSGELYRDLVFKKKIAIDFWVNYNFIQKVNTTFSIGVLPVKDNGNYNIIFKEIKDSINKAISLGFSENILQTEFNKIRDESEYLSEDSYRYIMYLATALNVGLTYEEVNDFPNKIQEVTLEDVKEVAQEIFSKKHIEAKALKE